MIGQRIGQYEIRRYLGSGGAGEVFLAWDHAGNQQVAVKLLKRHVAADPRSVTRFHRSVSAARRLRHPNLIRVYDSGVLTDGRPYLVMEYLPGGSLTDLIGQRRQFSERDALRLLRPLTQALEMAHSTGVVHRDLKPDNVMFRENREPVIVDLGIASVAWGEEVTRGSEMLGTPQYMAPEQFSQPGQVDGRADIYALGIILFEMLSGRRPVDGDNPWAIVHRKLNEPSPSLRRFRPKVSREVERLTATCLHREPARRYANAPALTAAIDQLLSGRPTTSTFSNLGGRWAPVVALVGALGLMLSWVLFGGLSQSPTETIVTRIVTRVVSVTRTPAPSRVVQVRELYGRPLEIWTDTQAGDDDLCESSGATSLVDSVELVDSRPRRFPAEGGLIAGRCYEQRFLRIRTLSSPQLEGWAHSYALDWYEAAGSVSGPEGGGQSFSGLLSFAGLLGLAHPGCSAQFQELCGGSRSPIGPLADSSLMPFGQPAR